MSFQRDRLETVHGAATDLLALTLLTDESVKTIPLGLYQFFGDDRIDWGMVMAGSVAAIVPTLALFLPLQRLLVGHARRLQRFLTQPFFVAAAYTGMEGRSVPLADTVAGCAAILSGECDDWEEGSLYMIGNLEEARARDAVRKGAAA